MNMIIIDKKLPWYVKILENSVETLVVLASLSESEPKQNNKNCRPEQH
jgi:hypothetical protein